MNMDLRDYGYAPGGYMFKCVDCPANLSIIDRPQGDKRAWRCKEHAIIAMYEHQKIINAPLICDMELSYNGN